MRGVTGSNSIEIGRRQSDAIKPREIAVAAADLYSLFPLDHEPAFGNPAFVAAISTEERAAPGTVNLAMTTVLEALRVNQAEAVVRRVLENITFDG